MHKHRLQYIDNSTGEMRYSFLQWKYFAGGLYYLNQTTCLEFDEPFDGQGVSTSHWYTIPVCNIIPIPILFFQTKHDSFSKYSITGMTEVLKTRIRWIIWECE